MRLAAMSLAFVTATGFALVMGNSEAAAVTAVSPTLAQSVAHPQCHICNRSIISDFILADRECDYDSYYRCIAPCNGTSRDIVNGTMPSVGAIIKCVNRCADRYGCTK